MKARQITAAVIILVILVVVVFAPAIPGVREHANDPLALGRTLGVISLLPPLLAVLLAFLLKDVVVSLLAGFVSGVALLISLRGGGVAATFTQSCTVILDTVSDRENCAIILLCIIIGGMIEVIRTSGGFEALAKALTKRINTPKKANLIAELLGLIVFFDDYANSLIVGPVMRPVTDKLKISRERLAFLVDSTAAPVTGIAIISSWVAVEVSVINEGFAIAGVEASGYTTFLQSIPFCFYCIFCLVLVFLTSLIGREYGPMLKAEIRARGGQTLRPGSNVDEQLNVVQESRNRKQGTLILTAVLPIVLLCVTAFITFFTDGRAAAIEAGEIAPDAAFSLETLAIAFGSADTIFLVMQASALGSVVAVVMGCIFRIFSLQDAVQAWLRGASSLVVTAVILTLAWSLSAVVEQLGTVYYVVDLISMNIPWQLVPSLIFLACCCIAFAAGSYGCMFIVMPMAIPIAFAVIERNMIPNEHTFLLVCIASVLSGGIFGDHCSPITDCTILSSMGSGCDNMDHVRTQMPYALTTAAVSVACGTLPSAFGLPAWVCLVVGIVVLFAIVRFLGKDPDKEYEKLIQSKLSEVCNEYSSRFSRG
jgi:Na+/H+ antiporter NhaC